MSFRRACLVLSFLVLAGPARAAVPSRVSPATVQAQQLAAQGGDTDAMVELAWRFHDGDGVVRDHAAAANWFRLAAGKGSASGMYGLALCLSQCTGVAHDPALADKLMREAADLGHADAQVEVGLSVERSDPVQALQWYAKAAHQDNSYGVRNLGLLYLQGRGVAPDPAKGYELMLKSAELGNPHAMADLGRAYEKGTGVRQDLQRARLWYREAAALGQADARFRLSRLYANGHGGEPDSEEALRLLRLGVEDGQVDSINLLGIMYLDGQGVPQDYVEAYRLLSKGVEIGDARSMVQLGRMHLSGAGRPVDLPAAIALFTRAAESGDSHGQFLLARCLEQGTGVARDDARAAQLFRQASGAGFAPATSYLIRMHVEGRGLPRNPARVQALVEQEIAAGNAGAILESAALLVEHGHAADAEPIIRRAAAQAASAVASRDLYFILALGRVGSAYRERREFDAAERYLKDQMALLDKLGNAPPAMVAENLEEMGYLYVESERPELAEPIFQRNLALHLAVHGPESAQAASSYGMLGTIHFMRDRFDQALHDKRLALDILEKALGRDDPKTARARGSLAQLLYFQGNYAQAEPLFLQSIAALEARFGQADASLAGPLGNLAYNHMERGQLALAEQGFRRALAIREKHSGGKPGHALATSWNNLGVLLTKAGKYREAEDLLSRSLRMREQVLGRRHKEVSISLKSLARLYLATGRHGQARAVLERAIAIMQADAPGRPGWQLAEVLHLQGLALRQLGRHAQAGDLLRQALDMRVQLQPAHHQTIETARDLAAVYRGMDNEKAALEVEQRANGAAGAAPVAAAAPAD
ncbi:tetratricopeptide repeat protein [Massilia niastensis]|uniref:tetratricopeptide repeat protein n=1 Tax=Massilia niastensis TaxID=544911 RepID=UPI00037D3C85|nr:tetratricopeptide repeat protein [Massilia niastensis]